ncbi:hypothetical protein RWH45_11855 [Microbacterium sp. KSW4-17]|uniref:Uncharacterized protein n=1 Tax=Microbacterium galbum TaxID=3075994 RepID=A0ABU3T965_9MICO|nr:hypothetical protein [Microbacterium sp. KSW4-17]MDU0367908.1 hypothetical protein [Microbacterium sp. KSW4-17]
MQSVRIQRRSRTKLVGAVLGVLLASIAVVLGSVPANATDARCTSDQLQIDCGVIYNTSGVNIRIATNFSPTYSSYVGTVSGVTATLGGNQNSNIFKDSSGRFYDWDAVYVPPTSCLTMNVGPGFGGTVDFRNTRSDGVWYKVNNLGANVRGLRSC